MRFNSHYKMTEDDVIDFVFEHTDYFSSNKELVCKEIGDGNINYVYRISEIKTGKSLILKQADIRTRIRPDGYLSPTRNLHEAEVLRTQAKYAGSTVPKVFFVDKNMSCFIMEDISGYSNLRLELMKGLVFPFLGKKLAEFIVKTTLPLTDIVFCGNKKPCIDTVSKDLSKITENLVFTYPYKDINSRNILLEENKKWLENNFYKNKRLSLAAAELKEEFKTYPQSLIHGDLHSGSIFVRTIEERESIRIKILDPEFAFYGPIGYDLGNIAAHFIFACVYSKYMKTENNEKFRIYCRDSVKQLFEEFTHLGIKYLSENVKDPIFKQKLFLNKYLQKIKESAVRFAGAEINRRVIGSAKVPEITSLENLETRLKMERHLAKIGIDLMINKDSTEELLLSHY